MPSIHDVLSQEYVSVDKSDTILDALKQLDEKGGDNEWILILKSPKGKYSGTSFFALNKFVQDKGADVLREPIGDLDINLHQFDSYDHSVKLKTVVEKSGGHPLQYAIILWEKAIIGLCPISSPVDKKEGSDQDIHELKDPPKKSKDKHTEKPPHTERLPPLKKYVTWVENNVFISVASFILLVAIPTLYFYIDLLPDPIEPMKGEWNIAVASFKVNTEDLTQDDGTLIANSFHNRLESEVTDLGEQADLVVELRGPDEIDPISGSTPDQRAENAKELAENINADIVIYGTVDKENDRYQLQPEFYISLKNQHEASELVGPHRFGDFIEIIGDQESISSQINTNRELSKRSQSLALITKGLSLAYVHAYDDALLLYQQADDSNLWGLNRGRETLKLFIGNAAGQTKELDEAETAYQEAIDLDPEYARAYVGLAGIYYLRSLEQTNSDLFIPNEQYLQLAIETFEQAQNADTQPEIVDIPEKIAFGLGQIYLAQWFSGESTLEKSVDEFSKVIHSYEEQDNQRIKTITAESYARLALISRSLEDFDKAVEYYNRALDISTYPLRRGIFYHSLGQTYEIMGEPTKAEEAYTNSNREYESQLNLTNDTIRKANHWKSISKNYLAIGQIQSAVNAIQEAKTLLPNNPNENGKLNPQDEEIFISVYQQSAEINLERDEVSSAILDYQSILEITPEPATQARYSFELASLYEITGEQTEKRDVLEGAIAFYKEAIKGTGSEKIIAYYWKQIAHCYDELDQTNSAIQAMEKAIDFLSEDSPRLQKYNDYLDEISNQ